jgi:hypothetical protein
MVFGDQNPNHVIRLGPYLYRLSLTILLHRSELGEFGHLVRCQLRVWGSHYTISRSQQPLGSKKRQEIDLSANTLWAKSSATQSTICLGAVTGTSPAR